MEEILEPNPPGTSLQHLRNALPPLRMRCARKIVIQALASLRRQGIDPFVSHCVIDHGGSKPNFRVNGFPCLTAGRASAGGPWVTTRGRRTTLLEMVRVQGMDYEGADFHCLTPAAIGRAIGNAMSQNVLEALFAELLPSMA